MALLASAIPLLWAMTTCAAPAQDRAADPRPNLVFVFSDQQSWDMLGCYGNKQVISPNLDRLAAQGVRFNHCISSAPICTPYRGMLLSGQHPLRNGAFENDVRMLPGDGNYFGEVLRDHSYRLGYYGKWHLYGGDRDRPVPPDPFRYGFDHEFVINNCTLHYDKEHAFYWDDNGRKQLYGDWEPYAQTRQAMQFIDQHAAQPFALFLSWHPPHNWPGGHEGYAAPDDCLKFYDPARVHLRANVEDTPKNRLIYQGHMAMITSIDRAFGWLMEKLEEKGLANQTIVVFTSDHGDTLFSHGFANNKMRPEQESIRVPLIIRYPPLLKPRASELLVATLDLMPTLLGMMKIPIPESCDGRNLTRAMAESRDDTVESVPLFLTPLNFRRLYTRRYTYTFDTSAGTAAFYRDMFFSKPEGVQWNCLYDRSTDPAETNNLFASPQHQKVRRQLHQMTVDWMKQFGDQSQPYETVSRILFTAEDRNFRQQKKWADFTGILKGRPIELLKQAENPTNSSSTPSSGTER